MYHVPDPAFIFAQRKRAAKDPYKTKRGERTRATVISVPDAKIKQVIFEQYTRDGRLKEQNKWQQRRLAVIEKKPVSAPIRRLDLSKPLKTRNIVKTKRQPPIPGGGSEATPAV